MREITRRARRSAAGTVERVQQAIKPDAAFLRHLGSVVESHPDPTVVLVSGPAADSPVAHRLARAGAPVHRVDPVVTDDFDVRLAALGGVDVAVVEGPDSAERTTVVERLVHHLASRGVLLVRDVGTDDEGVSALLERWTEDGTVADAGTSKTPKGGKGVQGGKGGKAGGPGAVRVERHATHAEVTVRRGHFLKLREEQTNPYLALAGPRVGRVIQTLEPVHWDSRARVSEAGEPPKRLPAEYAVPELNLREYRDVRCFPGQVAVQGSVILADSFRHNQRKTLGNQRLRTVSDPFASPDELRADVVPLAGDYFYLDSSYRGHFGHAMTEQLSRLWGWSRAKEQFPDLKALLLEEKRKDLYTFETELYSAAGVPADDIVLVPGPVHVERLVAATPMFSQPQYVHPDLGDVWATVSDALSARAGAAERPLRFFCSRRHGKRACHNTDEVEQLFVDHGFTIVFPEDHSLADQAAMFRDAEVVAGFAGSAMFNLLFCTTPTKVLMVASENYWAQNEYMISSVAGHDLTVAWCRPDVPRVPGAGFDPKTFHSPYTFDLDREGRLVLEVLQAL
jgi:capsular polysaccharide biosynthesis protein